MDNSITKKCSKCNELKDKKEFYNKKNECKKCYNSEERRAKHKLWIMAHPEKNKIYYKTKYKKYPEIILERNRKWAEANPVKVYESNKKWRKNNPDKIAVSKKRWNDSNLEKNLANWHNRRARILGNGGKITAQEWVGLKKKYDYTCLDCKRQEPEIALTLDHVKPLYSGGANTIENAQPLCKSCNSSKHTKEVDYR